MRKATKTGDPAPSNIVRNPTKKRGRPKKETSAHKAMAGLCGARNGADMLSAVLHGMPKDLQAELLPLADRKEVSVTVLAYVARFPPDQQREMFEVLRPLGARGAKRYVECLTRPPSAMQMGHRIARWAVREFPSLTFDDIAAGLRKALVYLEAYRVASASQEAEDK
jgi:hypothetical protein